MFEVTVPEKKIASSFTPHNDGYKMSLENKPKITPQETSKMKSCLSDSEFFSFSFEDDNFRVKVSKD